VSLIKVSELAIYPVKSTKAIPLTHCAVTGRGLDHDRSFMVTDLQGQFITGRAHPKLSLIKIDIVAQGIILSAPNMPMIAFKYRDLSSHYQAVTIWGKDVSGQHCSVEMNAWLSRYLAVPCQLIYFGENSQRRVKDTDKTVAFADGYPILLVSQASLDALNKLTVKPISMSQFRANIVVTGCAAFAEDSWKRVRIAGVEYELVKPCERCIFTTLQPDSLEYSQEREPLTSLSLFRKDEEGKIDFGQNLVCMGEGEISIADTVEILELHTPKFYPDNRPTLNIKNTTKAALKVNHESVRKTKWQKEETRQLRCVAVIEETHDTKTFRFQVEPAAICSYKPGQFITLNLKVGQDLVTRNYTLSSSPSRPDLLAITVKRVENGKASNWLNDNLTVGDRIGASAPRGLFHAFVAPTKKLLLLSAGSGITPMLSMARYYADVECDKDIVFFYSAKSEADLIALDELKLLARQHTNLRLIFTLTQQDSTKKQQQNDWYGLRGRIDQTMLAEMVDDITERATFVCGPEAFMQTMQATLQTLGLPAEQYFQESFGDHKHSNVVSKPVSILMDSWDTHFTGNNKTTLLEQAENNGVQLPYNCRAGFCGLCRVTLEQGEVRELADHGLTAQDKENKQVLACSCIPETDVVISQV